MSLQASTYPTRLLPEFGFYSGAALSQQRQRTRYPGPRPFEDDALDRQLFYGRERCGQELLHQVLSTRLLLMFGKSGTGKTSLLRAHVVPALRERDLLPIHVRLNCAATDLVESVLSQIECACDSPGVALSPGERSHLWLYFKTAVFSRGDALVRPVLIFDQFEEIFSRQDRAARERLIAQLGELLGDGVPTSVRHLSGDAGISCSSGPPEVKVILSLREDYLGLLQELTPFVPGLFHCRFRLTPLDRDGARAAIVEPARLAVPGAVLTQTFEFAAQSVEQMLDFLENEDGEIEPFQLQLLCRRVETALLKAQQAGQQGTWVDPKLLGGRAGMERILEGFYREVIRLYPAVRRRRVRRLCEQGLLTRNGVRREVEQSSIIESYGVTAAELERLVDSRLLRKEQRRGAYYHEISHDSLAKPILGARPQPTSWKHILVEAVVLVAVALYAVYWFWSEAEDAKAVAREAQTRSEYLQSNLASIERQAKTDRGEMQAAELAKQRAQELRDGLAAVYKRVVDQHSDRIIVSNRLAAGGTGPEMLPVPAGVFRMGGVGSEHTQPAHDVRVARPFAIGRFEVTRGEFAAFAAATGYRTDAERNDGCRLYQPGESGRRNTPPQRGTSWRQPGIDQNDRHPVVCVSWNDARAYAEWLSLQSGEHYRLPTEAEWEYAARAGTATTYWWGNELSDDRANCGDCLGGPAVAATAAVGSYLPNPFGLSDTAGNAAEWTADCWHDDYVGAPRAAQVAWVPVDDANCERRVIRGGTWYGVGDWTRSDGRWRRPADATYNSQGFRLVRELPETAVAGR